MLIIKLSPIYSKQEAQQRQDNIKSWLKKHHPSFNLNTNLYPEIKEFLYRDNPEPDTFYYFYDDANNTIIDQNHITNYYYNTIKPLTNILALNPNVHALTLKNMIKQITVQFCHTKQDHQPYIVIKQYQFYSISSNTHHRFFWSSNKQNQVIWYLNTDGIYSKTNACTFLLTINRSIDSTHGPLNLLYDCTELAKCKPYWQEMQKIQAYDLQNKTPITYTEILRNPKLNRTELLCHHWKRLENLNKKINFDQFDLTEINLLRGLQANVTDNEFQKVVNYLLNNRHSFHQNFPQIAQSLNVFSSPHQWMILYIAYLYDHFIDLKTNTPSLSYNFLADFILMHKQKLKSHHKLEFPKNKSSYYD